MVATDSQDSVAKKEKGTAGAQQAPPSEAENAQESEYYGQDRNHDYCDCCKEFGTVLCCDSCPCSFHPECVDPPSLKFPQVDSWFCSSCSRKAEVRNPKAKRPAVLDQAGPLAPLVSRLLGMNPILFNLNSLDESVVGDSRGSEHRRRAGRPARRTMECCELSTGECAQCRICTQRFHIFCLEPPLVNVPAYFECDKHIKDDTDSPNSEAAIMRKALASGAPYACNDYLLQDRVKIDKKLEHAPFVVTRSRDDVKVNEEDLDDCKNSILDLMFSKRSKEEEYADLQKMLDDDAKVAEKLGISDDDGTKVTGVYTDPDVPFVLTQKNACLFELMSQFSKWKNMMRKDCEVFRLKKRQRLDSEEEDRPVEDYFQLSRGATEMKLKVMHKAQDDLAKAIVEEQERKRQLEEQARQLHSMESDEELDWRARRRARREALAAANNSSDERGRKRGRPKAAGTPQHGEAEKPEEPEVEMTVVPLKPTHNVSLTKEAFDRFPQASNYAHLVYYDPITKQEYIVAHMRYKGVLHIGRQKTGEKAPQVDLKELFGDDNFRNVSHEHCRIEYRAKTKTYHIVSTSKAGVTVLLPVPVTSAKKDPIQIHLGVDEEHEIVSGTVISLASSTLPFRFVVPPDCKMPRFF